MPSKRLNTFARRLRTEATDAERKLWQLLRAHRFQDFKFRRQQPIGSYIVDSICLDAKLIVELDGGQHAEAVEYDGWRDAWLQNEGYRVLRIWNNELFENETGAMEKILEMLTLSPTPPLQGAFRLARRNRSTGAEHAPRIPRLAPSRGRGIKKGSLLKGEGSPS